MHKINPGLQTPKNPILKAYPEKDTKEQVGETRGHLV
jgi:hypothetical protein